MSFNNDSDWVYIFFNCISARFVYWDALGILVLGFILAFIFEDFISDFIGTVIHLNSQIVSHNGSDNGESPVLLNMDNKTSQRSLLMKSFDCTPKKIAKPS